MWWRKTKEDSRKCSQRRREEVGFKESEGSEVQTSGGKVSQEVWKVMQKLGGWDGGICLARSRNRKKTRVAGPQWWQTDRQTTLEQPAARHWVVDHYGGEVGSSRGFSSVQSLSCVWLFATPRTAHRQAFLSITNTQSLFRLMSIKSVMPSNHLILCHPLLLPPQRWSNWGNKNYPPAGRCANHSRGRRGRAGWTEGTSRISAVETRWPSSTERATGMVEKQVGQEYVEGRAHSVWW